MANSSQICLSENQMHMHGNEAEKYLQRYLYPCVVLLGIAGNLLNLSVLLNRAMRSRSNSFLAALAIADIIFLVLLVPNILANYPVFTFNFWFRYLYFHVRIHLFSLTNWTSSAAIWIVIAVCADRLIGIRRPLSAKASWSPRKIPIIIATIVFLTGLVNLYQHFQFECPIRQYCNRTQLYSKCLPINSNGPWFQNRTNPYSPLYRKLVSISVVVNAIATIFLPIFLLTTLNVLLLCTLRGRRVQLLRITNQTNQLNGSLRKASSVRQCHKTESRVTLTVALIVTTFTVMNGPSAVIHLLNLAHSQKQSYDLTLIGNTLVIIGKACNFALFCLTSGHFRARLYHLNQRKMLKISASINDVGSNIRENARRCRSHSQLRISSNFHALKKHSQDSILRLPMDTREGSDRTKFNSVNFNAAH